MEASRRTVSAFLRIHSSEELLRKNRITTLEFLRMLAEKNETVLQETCILALGQVAL